MILMVEGAGCSDNAGMFHHIIACHRLSILKEQAARNKKHQYIVY